jgi:hypothetical protein
MTQTTKNEFANQLDFITAMSDSLNQAISIYLKPINLTNIGVYWDDNSGAWRVRFKNNKKYNYKQVKSFRGSEKKAEAYEYAKLLDNSLSFAINANTL